MVNTSPNHQGNALDTTLAELVDLGLLAKQAHWNVIGPRFRALHLLLDELAGVARDSADALAERAVTLGHAPDGRSSTIVKLSCLPTVAAGPLRDVDAISGLVDVLDAVVGRIYLASEAFEKDAVTIGLLTNVLAAVERFAWMLRAQRDP